GARVAGAAVADVRRRRQRRDALAHYVDGIGSRAVVVVAAGGDESNQEEDTAPARQAREPSIRSRHGDAGSSLPMPASSAPQNRAGFPPHHGAATFRAP